MSAELDRTDGITIHDAERMVANDALMERLTRAVYYGGNRARDPGFSALWAAVDPRVKGYCRKGAEEMIRAAVTDYTTPGCTCDYCLHFRAGGRTGHGVKLMCAQRWHALPGEVQRDIADSIAD